MAVTVYFENITKRRNSTLQGTFTTSYDCVFKAPTSLDRPTFLVSAASMDYNAAKMGDRYYFIDDVVSVREGQWEVTCVLDVLATYKSDILASTQFVAYSSYNSSVWLTDTRIPVLQSETQAREVAAGVLPFNSIGFYALTATGRDGTSIYAMTESEIKDLIGEVNSWAADFYDDIMDGSWASETYNFTGSVPAALESLAKISTQTGFLGNAYANAPQNIRSCIWLPLLKSRFSSGNVPLYLGNFDTQMSLPVVDVSPVTDTFSVDIPWQFNDWRRSVCESIYLYLPFAGVINLPTDLISSDSTIGIQWSISPSDGNVAYLVWSGANNIIGTYGGKLGGEYAIGINQQASLGEIVQTAFAGAEKTVNAVINTSLSPASMVAGGVGATMAGIETAYQTANVAMSTHPTTIGTFGGCAASKLLGQVVVGSVAHPISATPASMVTTMGLPTMQTMSLSSLTGYCQCVNAHVAAAAQAQELDAIDRYLNSGFFIE